MLLICAVFPFDTSGSTPNAGLLSFLSGGGKPTEPTRRTRRANTRRSLFGSPRNAEIVARLHLGGVKRHDTDPCSLGGGDGGVRFEQNRLACLDCQQLAAAFSH